MREWSEINADLWRLEKESKGHKNVGGAKAFQAYAASMSDGESQA